jgi:hypothetical protein
VIHALLPGIIGELNQTTMQPKIGDKFKLLGEVFTVTRLLGDSQFISHTSDDSSTNELIYLDLSKADKLEWIEEEKPDVLFCEPMLKSEIIREVLEMVADTWDERGGNPSSFSNYLRKQAREME